VSDAPLDPAAAIAELARIDYSRNDLQQVLTTIATLARRGIPASAGVSVTLVTEGSGTTAAFTDDIAVALDEQQYDRGYGPCLEACESGETLVMADAGTENRWPGFTRRAVELGVHSSMSLPLPLQDAVTGALNMYSVRPGAFDDTALRTATTFAEYAGVAVANAQWHASAAALTEQMRHAARARAVIDQAKGILMARRACTAEQAINVLILAARASGRRLRDVAGVLVGAAQPAPLPDGAQELLAVIDDIPTSGTSVTD
jgi:GAF domain-containing protein